MSGFCGTGQTSGLAMGHQAMEHQAMGAQSMGNQAMGFQSMGNQAMGYQSMGGAQATGYQGTGAQSMGGAQAMGYQGMGIQSTSPMINAGGDHPGASSTGGGSCSRIQIVQGSRSVSVPCTRNVCKTIKVPTTKQITRYRQEPRSYTYQSTEIRTRPKIVKQPKQIMTSKMTTESKTIMVPKQIMVPKTIQVPKSIQVPKTIFVDVTTTEQYSAPVTKTGTRSVTVPYQITVPAYRLANKCDQVTKIVRRQVPVFNVVAKQGPAPVQGIRYLPGGAIIDQAAAAPILAANERANAPTTGAGGMGPGADGPTGMSGMPASGYHTSMDISVMAPTGWTQYNGTGAATGYNTGVDMGTSGMGATGAATGYSTGATGYGAATGYSTGATGYGAATGYSTGADMGTSGMGYSSGAAVGTSGMGYSSGAAVGTSGLGATAYSSGAGMGATGYSSGAATGMSYGQSSGRKVVGTVNINSQGPEPIRNQASGAGSQASGAGGVRDLDGDGVVSQAEANAQGFKLQRA